MTERPDVSPTPSGGDAQSADVPLRILVIEDEASAAALVNEYLQQGGLDFRMLHAETLRRGEELLALQTVDCVILDLSLPDSDHLDTLRVLVQDDPTVPVLVLTGVDDVIGLQALSMGAQDFLRKQELSAVSLTRAVTFAIERFHSLRALADANQQLDQFADVVSHDLRAPLTAAEGHLRLFIKRHGEELDPSATRLLAHISNSHQRMRQLIEGTLTFARLRHDRVRIDAVDLDRLFRRVIGYLEVNEQIVTIRQPLPSIQADSILIEKVVENVLDNAIRYVPDGKTPAVEVWAERLDGGWEINIADNGDGFPDALRERAFDPYRRLPNSAGHDGTGLGLAIARQVLKRHQGTITAHDHDGGGSIIRMWFPDEVRP